MNSYGIMNIKQKIYLNLSNENAELLSVIIDTQYIYLDHLTSITFENIYNKIDESKLTEIQLEELNKIKEELSKIISYGL